MADQFQDAPLNAVQVKTAAYVDAPLTPPGNDRTRQDTSIVGIDHAAIANRIADWASTLRPSLQKPAAWLATLPADVLASLVETISAPESIATGGAKPALAAMDSAGAAATTVGRAVVSPAAREAAAKLVKLGSTGVGAVVGHAPGAVIGSTVGDILADAVRPSAAASVSNVAPSGVETAQAALARKAATVQPGPLATDLAARRAAFEARVAASRNPTPVAPAPAGMASVPPVTAGAPTPPIAPPAPTVAAPAPVQPLAATSMPNQIAINNLGMMARRAKLNLSLDEIQALVPLVEQGQTPAQVIETLRVQQPAKALLSMPGTLSDAEVRAAIDARNARGKIKTPSAETAKARRAGSEP